MIVFQGLTPLARVVSPLRGLVVGNERGGLVAEEVGLGDSGGDGERGSATEAAGG